MKDVVAVFRAHTTNDQELRALIEELATTHTAQNNIIFAEFVRRIRKAAGISEPQKERGDLLQWLDQNEHA